MVILLLSIEGHWRSDVRMAMVSLRKCRYTSCAIHVPHLLIGGRMSSVTTKYGSVGYHNFGTPIVSVEYRIEARISPCLDTRTCSGFQLVIKISTVPSVLFHVSSLTVLMVAIFSFIGGGRYRTHSDVFFCHKNVKDRSRW
jgi:hypothetical protein